MSQIFDRLTDFLKSEWGDYFSEKKNTTAHNPSAGSDESWWQQFYEFILGNTPQPPPPNTEEQRRAYEAYQRTQPPPPDPRLAEEAKYFDALEIVPTQDFEVIKAAYKRAMKKYHPDRFAHDAAKQDIAEKISRRVNEAYQYFEQKFGR